MKNIVILILIFTVVLSANSDRALKMMKIEQRVALVIGNNNYDSDRLSKLKNPINDAKAMRDKLKTLGFQVYYGENLRVRDMDKELRSFSSKLRNGGVGLFFFAGHGVESQGKNYLMGKDSNLVDKLDIAYESLELDKVIEAMKNSGNRLSIVLLDACRNDPFSRSGGGGLAKVDNAKGMFIAYATSPGDVASDGSGKHGVFTEEILNHIDSEGVPIGRMFKKVKRGVYTKTNETQRPWTYDDIIGDFFFKLPDSNVNTRTDIFLNEQKIEEPKKVIQEETLKKQKSEIQPKVVKKEIKDSIPDSYNIGGKYLNNLTFDGVVKKFGNDYELIDHNQYSWEIKYKELGLSFYYKYNDNRKKIISIHITSPYMLKTNAGIVLNQSTMQDVYNFYGKISWLASRGSDYWWSEHAGIAYYIERDKSIKQFPVDKEKHIKKKIVKIVIR
jgi:hypothetical protein